MNKSIIFILFVLNSAAQEEQIQIKPHVIQGIVEKLIKPVVLVPTNKDVEEAQHFYGNQFHLSRFRLKNVELCLEALLNQKEIEKDDIEKVTKVMTYFLFKKNDSEKPDQLALPLVSQEYLDNYRWFLLELAIIETKKLIKPTGWQIISTMPSLYDTLATMKLLNPQPDTFEQQHFTSPHSEHYVHYYLKSIANAAASTDATTRVVLTRLVQKLGDNIGFLNYIANTIGKLSFFEKRLNCANNLLGKERSLPESLCLLVDSVKAENEVNAIRKEIYAHRDGVGKK